MPDALTTEDSGFDAADAFLTAWGVDPADAAKPSETTDHDEDLKRRRSASAETEETKDDTKDADKQPSEEETEETEDKEEESKETEDKEDDTKSDDKASKAKKPIEDEDAVFHVKVGDETHEVTAADLKRLYGQEKALTQRGMEIASTRKQLEDQGARHVAASEALLQKAQGRLKEFEGIDWVQAAVKLAPAEYQALRQSAEMAWTDVNFLQQGLDTYMGQVQQQRNDLLVKEAKETLKELSDPVTGIKDFSKDLYAEMRTFALDAGIPREMMDTIVSAPALRIIHKAMMFDRGQKALTKTKTVNKTPKQIVKTKATSDRQPAKEPAKKAMDKLRRSGHEDDAAAAFEERFASYGRDD